MKNSGSTCHLSTSYGLALVCRRWTEHVRPEVVPADAGCGLDRDATIRGNCTPRLPFADRGGFDAKDFGQALLRADRADSSVDGGLGVHASHLRSNLIYGQQGKPNFISGIVR